MSNNRQSAPPRIGRSSDSTSRLRPRNTRGNNSQQTLPTLLNRCGLIMESVQGSSKTSKLASEDIISSMPENVITNILDSLPIQDAVKTSILSRNWRFNWTLLSQLVFDENFCKYLQRKRGNQLFYKRNLGRLLLHFRGFITKFVLYLPDRDDYETQDDINDDINHWILFLSTKGMTEFVFRNIRTSQRFSTHLFSCVELKHLKLHGCRLQYIPAFHGFPNLLSLEFHDVTFESCICQEFITGCPLLEILKINNHNHIVSCRHNGEVKLAEMANLKNLRMLSLSLFTLGHKTIARSDLFQLMGFFPKLEELDLDLLRSKFIAEADVRMSFSSTLPCLKTLELGGIDFNCNVMVSSVWDLINGSPNLQTLKIRASHFNEDEEEDVDDVSSPPVGSWDVDCGISGKLQLRSVELSSMKDSEIDICFIKSLLASSSLLEKMVIHKTFELRANRYEENYKFAKKLLKLRRASSIAEIEVD